MAKIWKTASLLALLFILLISLTLPEAHAASTYKATVTAEKLEIKSGAGAKYKTVGYYKKGAAITVFSKTSTGWSEVKHNQKKAYVLTKSLKFDTPTSATAKVNRFTTQADDELVYPQITGLSTKSVQEKINLTLRNHIRNSMKNKQQLMADLEEFKEESGGEYADFEYAWEYKTSYEVAYNKNKTVSIIMYDYQYTGGAHGMTKATTYNFSITTGKRIFINDVLKTTTNYKKVKNHAYKTIINSSDDKLFLVRSLNDFTVNKNTQFVYADGGIRLVFQEYEVAAYAAGHPKVNIPYAIYK